MASSRLRQGLSHLGYQETWTRDGRTALDTRSSLQPRVDLAPAEALSGSAAQVPTRLAVNATQVSGHNRET